ncbi:MAG TPA: adenine deaminase C-terminal domain-containing protein [Syntrophorhabdaceae bacterium]|nr:adenine deaminase C-terminal domain-containing protein [Syntrophorhabdaceae bacterium]
MLDKSFEDLKGLMRVSLGDRPPDILITDVAILEVFSSAIFTGHIWIYKHWIAFVGDKKPPVTESTTIIDGKGKIAVPGYVDAHGHTDLFYNPSTFADAVITRGATTVFSDSDDLIDSIGVAGFMEVLKVSDAFAVKYLWGVPATYPPYPDVEGGDLFPAEDLLNLLRESKECAAMSELSSYLRILRNEDDILQKVFLAKSLGKNIEGHTLGASYDKLNALAAAGITSCHESISGADLRNRVRLGFYTMIRHSSIRSDLEELCSVARVLPKDSIMLVSDGIFANDLSEKGYMDFVIQDAINFGLDPIDAIKMSTLNPARYLKVDGDVGSIAPGRIADILLVNDITQPTPDTVIEKGRIAAKDGELLSPSAPFPEIGNQYNPYVFTAVAPDEFQVPRRDFNLVPVIDVVDRTVTRRVDLPFRNCQQLLLPEKENDVRKVLYTRRDKKKWGRGFVRGIGADIGGIATTVAHETHGLMVLGFDDDDMAMAGNVVLEMGGGIVLVDHRTILCKLALPLGATMSYLRIEELAREIKKINKTLQDRGSKLDDPFLTITYLTLTTIIEMRITVSGVYDVKKAAIVF